jgi:hypothetical protein
VACLHATTDEVAVAIFVVVRPLVRSTRRDVRDLIDSHKSDHRPSYLSYRALQRRGQLKTDLREIFGPW